MAESITLERAGAARASRMDESLVLLSAVADPVRWTVLSQLAQQGTCCVCVLQQRAPVAANLLSYHLKVLRDAGLVTTSRRGRWVDYSLAQGAFERLAQALPVGEAAVLP